MGQCQISATNNKIDILNIPVSDLRSDFPVEACLFKYRDRMLKLKNCSDFTSKDMTLKGTLLQEINIIEGTDNHLSILSKKYDYLSEGLLFENQGLQITQILMDQFHVNKLLYIATKQKQRYTYIVRNFDSYYNREFLNIFYEVNTYQKINSLQTPYLHHLIKTYTIHSNGNFIEFIGSHSQVLQLEAIDTNLALILKHRRANNQPWTFIEFFTLMKHLVSAVQTLHNAKMIHNDIRPSNIYYSSRRKCYILGSYSNISNASDFIDKDILQKQSLYFRNRKRNGSFDISRSCEDENMKSDVYSLGITFLAAFYLVKEVDRKKCAPLNRQLCKQYPFLDIIKMMICSIEKRSSIFQVKQKLKELQLSLKINPHDNLFVNYSDVANNFVDQYKRERYIADAYKMLSLVNSWKDRLKNRHIHKKISENSVESAKYYEELAVISSLQGKVEKSKNYYKHSAEIYYAIGNINFKERDFEKAISFFQEGLDNFNKIQEKEDSLTYMHLLISLYQSKITSGYQLINESQLYKLEKLINKIKDVETFAFWQYTMQLINIYKYYQNYNKVAELLKVCKEEAHHIQSKIGPITLDKMIIKNNSQLAVEKQKLQRTSLLTQSENSIFTILNDKQYFFISNPLQKLQLNLLSAQVKVMKGATRQAINILEDLSQQTFDTYDSLDDQIKSQYINRFLTVKCEIYELLGDIWNDHEELDNAMKFYTIALKNYMEYFGDMYNIQSALLLQKISGINRKNKKFIAYFQTIDLVMRILKTEYGRSHKDILRLQYHLKRQSRRSTKELSTNQQQVSGPDTDMQQHSFMCQ